MHQKTLELRPNSHEPSRTTHADRSTCRVCQSDGDCIRRTDVTSRKQCHVYASFDLDLITNCGRRYRHRPDCSRSTSGKGGRSNRGTPDILISNIDRQRVRVAYVLAPRPAV